MPYFFASSGLKIAVCGLGLLVYDLLSASGAETIIVKLDLSDIPSGSDMQIAPFEACPLKKPSSASGLGDNRLFVSDSFEADNGSSEASGAKSLVFSKVKGSSRISFSFEWPADVLTLGGDIEVSIDLFLPKMEDSTGNIIIGIYSGNEGIGALQIGRTGVMELISLSTDGNQIDNLGRLPIGVKVNDLSIRMNCKDGEMTLSRGPKILGTAKITAGHLPNALVISSSTDPLASRIISFSDIRVVHHD